jgi:predicted nuclease of predicted toxin-antitoxin system
MKFIVDAQLPYRLKNWLIAKDYDTIHTEDFLEQSLTADLEIVRLPNEKTEP